MKTSRTVGRVADPEPRTIRVGPSWTIRVPFDIEVAGVEIEVPEVALVQMRIDLLGATLVPIAITVQTIDGEPVTGTLLRRIPIARITRDGVVTELDEVLSDVDGSLAIRHGVPAINAVQAEVIRLRGPVDESLRVTASIYELARLTGAAPAREVENVLGMPRTTVTKWIRRARDRGYLVDGDDGAAS